jgi:hypothetical protein
VKASVGDRVTVHGRTVDEKSRDGMVLEVRGADGAPPWLIRWDDGHEALFFPGPDAHIEHYPHVVPVA